MNLIKLMNIILMLVLATLPFYKYLFSWLVEFKTKRNTISN